nr:hypothetical protein [Tanacetum cinerariifolium]
RVGLCQGQTQCRLRRVHLHRAGWRRTPDERRALHRFDFPSAMGPRRSVAGGGRYQRRQGAFDVLSQVRRPAAQSAGEGRETGGKPKPAAPAADLQKRPGSVSRLGRWRQLSDVADGHSPPEIPA